MPEHQTVCLVPGSSSRAQPLSLLGPQLVEADGVLGKAEAPPHENNCKLKKTTPVTGWFRERSAYGLISEGVGSFCDTLELRLRLQV